MRPSAATLSRARAMNLANLPDTATVFLRGEKTDDGEGGWNHGESIVLNMPCRVSVPGSGQAKPMEAVSAEQLMDPGIAVLTYAHDVDLPITAMLVVTRKSGDVERYDVVGKVPDSSYTVMRRVVIRRAKEVAP